MSRSIAILQVGCVTAAPAALVHSVSLTFSLMFASSLCVDGKSGCVWSWVLAFDSSLIYRAVTFTVLLGFVVTEKLNWRLNKTKHCFSENCELAPLSSAFAPVMV